MVDFVEFEKELSKIRKHHRALLCLLQGLENDVVIQPVLLALDGFDCGS